VALVCGCGARWAMIACRKVCASQVRPSARVVSVYSVCAAPVWGEMLAWGRVLG
jgi:hypothetical protein